MVNKTPEVKDDIIKACIETFLRQIKALNISQDLITMSFHKTPTSRYQNTVQQKPEFTER